VIPDRQGSLEGGSEDLVTARGLCFARTQMLRKTHGSLVVAVLLTGCSLLVEGTLEGKPPTDGGGGNTDDRRCNSDEECLLFPDHVTDCTQVCVGAMPGTPGTCRRDDPVGTPDTTACGGPGSGRICVDRACKVRGCGDGYVDREASPPEYCDDGDTNDTNTCNNSCTRRCTAPAPPNCNDGNSCNGAETCGAAGVCEGSALEADGTACMIGGDTGTCEHGACVVD
jgi:hypothetical protein